jgi:hypothetical protein
MARCAVTGAALTMVCLAGQGLVSIVRLDLWVGVAWGEWGGQLFFQHAP